MDGCLACKSCVGQCPVKIDVPAFRSRFLEVYHGRYLRPAKDFWVARLEAFLPLAARAPRLAKCGDARPPWSRVGASPRTRRAA
jgi:Fe-S oxidoreductase